MAKPAGGAFALYRRPGAAFFGRTLRDRDRTLWASWVVQSGEQRIFFSGDSGYFPGFAQIGERLGGFDLAYHPWQDPLIGEVLTVGQPRSNVLWWKALR